MLNTDYGRDEERRGRSLEDHEQQNTIDVDDGILVISLLEVDASQKQPHHLNTRDNKTIDHKYAKYTNGYNNM